MNDRPDNTKETSRSEGRSRIRDILADKFRKIKEKEITCPFCREVVKGIAAFGRHLKGHCT